MDLSWFASATAYDFCSMMGFYNGPDAQQLACSRVWSKQDRLLMSSYLENAKDRVEHYLGYPLTPRFICDERKPWNVRGLVGPLNWGYLQKFGTRTEEDVEEITLLDADLADDTVTITATVDFTDTCEARLFHTDANGGEEIYPISKSITGTTLTLVVNKCALVDPTVIIPENGLDYETLSNFVHELVIKRIYADPGTGTSLIWYPNTSSCNACSPCTEQSQLACPTIREKRNSSAFLRPASFANDEWIGAAFSNCNRYPDAVELDYLAYYDEDCRDGCERIPLTLQWSIIHVALADMPRPVCGCTVHSATFREDADFPRFLPRDNPFGIKIGHIIAYNQLKHMAIGQGGLLLAI